MHWDSLFIDRSSAMYFDSFVIEYISQNVLNKIKDNQPLITYSECSLMIVLCVVLLYGFYRIYDCRKNLFRRFLEVIFS